MRKLQLLSEHLRQDIGYGARVLWRSPGSALLRLAYLAGFGIFWINAFTVAQRTRGIGVCMALGAGPRHIVGALLSRYARRASLGSRL